MRISRFVTLIAASLMSVSLAGQGNMVQTHMGHVMDAFNGTPMNQGLLPTAMAEARIAAQHAGLAANSTTLAMMQTHAGHVIHAIDPTIVAMGPGLGYGLKKAAAAAGTHADLAGKAPEANAGVKTHSMHVMTAANSAATRAQEVLDIAQKIRAATSLDEAKKMATEMQAKAEQITAGFDTDGNGTINWAAPEGGLAQAQTHMGLMKTAAGS